jgi:hypothetical protein
MRTANRRRTTWAIAVSALAHLGVLAAALLQHSTLPPQLLDAAGPPEAIIPVLILPRGRLAAADATPRLGELQLHRRPQRLDQNPSLSQPSPLAPLPAAPALAKPSEVGQPAALAAQGQPATPGAPGPDLRAALRHGALGCANLAAVGMTRAEREACEEQLGHGAGQAPVLAVSLEPRIRAYYDAVALAKTRDPPLMPPRNDRAPIPGDPAPHRPGADHVPLIGCAIPFGPGEKPKLPAHWLKLGPCFIAPPKGPLTVEADITPP